MFNIINHVDGFRDPEHTFFYTDTDSIIVHRKTADLLKEFFKPSVLGMLDRDIKGKITRYISLCPKVYLCEYTTDEGEREVHKRAKGITKKQRKDLSYDKLWGCLINDEKIHCSVEKFKKTVFNINGEHFSVDAYNLQRTLNKTHYKKRHIDREHKYFLSYPVGYEHQQGLE